MMTDTFEAVLARIRNLAEEALTQTGLPPAAAQALETIVALTQAERDDTPEASDPPHTDNQSL